ncbi:SAV_2336 N-terminal domain-related protein [Streptomyces sp. NPDC086766]|uniref:SAV_2336 N-terminal domain-related protein n=1 Tax=Streptomyces sp. NPDC086766 TaxID=3365754 RepID=UPI00382A165C
MPSEEGAPGGVARLADLLAETSGGHRPTSVELAEVLWLAGHLRGPGTPEPTAEAERPAERGPFPPPPEDGPGPALPPDGPPRPPADRPHRQPGRRVPLSLPGALDRPGAHRALLAPAPPMLSHPLALQRALRPLKRLVPAPHGREVDEEATAHRIARLGAHPRCWLPVLRPATERWLTLHLVYDAGPTMPVWRPLIRELHTALGQSGVFRTVELHRLAADGTVRHGNAPPLHTAGRSAALVVSDCMGAQWREGPEGSRWYRTLRRWAAAMPVAVVQPLPERLWRTTALPTVPALLSAPGRAAPNSACAVDAYGSGELPDGVLPLPVLEASAPWLAHWAELVGSASRAALPGAVGLLGGAPPPAPVDEEGRGDVARLSPEELVLRFRSIASPQAFRLAGHLAVGRPELPVMRLVQAAIEDAPHPQHLAEVILSGVLTTADGPPGSYAFRPGVREVLLRTLPRTDRSRTTELLARVGAVIDARAGVRAGELRVLAPGGGQDAAGDPIAAVRRRSVRRLGGTDADDSRELIGGRYRLVDRRGAGERVWEAVDERTGRPVVVHLYPEQASAERFLRQARELAAVHSPHVVPVTAYGVEGETPYLVAEFVDGVTLTELEAGSGPGVCFRVFARLACQTVAGLQALHARGLVRGQAGADGLLLRPDGTVVLSRFALGEESEGMSPARDFRVLDRLLRRLLPTVRAPREFALLAQLDGRRLTARSAAALLDSAQHADRLRFTLLGRPAVFSGGRLPAGPRPESAEAWALLCVLLLRHGRRVTWHELAHGIWSDPPAPTGPATRERVARLAEELVRHLGPGTLAALPDGYALHTAGGYLDVAHCEELLARRRRTPWQDLRARRALTQEALGLFRGDPLDGVPGPFAQSTRARLRALHRSLTAGPEDLEPAETGPPGGDRVRPVIAFESDALPGRPLLRDALVRTVTGLVARGDLDPGRCAVLGRRNGCVVVAEPGVSVLPLLVAVLRLLPGAGGPTAGVPRLRVSFWRAPWTGDPDLSVLSRSARSAVRRVTEDAVVVVCPALYEEYARSSAAPGFPSFRPLYGGTPQDPPLAWCLPVRGAAGPEGGDLVRGPFGTGDPARLHHRVPGGTALVMAPPSGPPALLDPARPRGDRAQRVTTYYEVDLTTHRATHEVSLPSAGKGAFRATVELSWHVDDPVAVVHGRPSGVGARLLRRFVDEASRITRRYPVRHASAAQRAAQHGVRHWPVPGLTVTCAVRLTSERQALLRPRRPDTGRSP